MTLKSNTYSKNNELRSANKTDLKPYLNDLCHIIGMI
jgi:hypothetical protein